jgi:hypothetical protein
MLNNLSSGSVALGQEDKLLSEFGERLRQHQETFVMRFKIMSAERIVFERTQYLHPPSL